VLSSGLPWLKEIGSIPLWNRFLSLIGGGPFIDARQLFKVKKAFP